MIEYKIAFSIYMAVCVCVCVCVLKMELIVGFTCVRILEGLKISTKQRLKIIRTVF